MMCVSLLSLTQLDVRPLAPTTTSTRLAGNIARDDPLGTTPHFNLINVCSWDELNTMSCAEGSHTRYETRCRYRLEFYSFLAYPPTVLGRKGNYTIRKVMMLCA